MKRTPVLLMLLLAVSCSKEQSKPSVNPPAQKAETAASAPAVAPSGPATGSSSIEGVVTFAGAVPAESKNPAATSPDCKALPNDENQKSVRVTNGKLMNVFVYVLDGLPKGATYPVPSEPAKLDQEKCAYVPRVIGAQAGQPIAILNSDPTLHNVHAAPKASPAFNLGMPVKGMTMTRSFAKSEVMVPIKCDVHGWMRAYVGVLDHPFFSVSDKDGKFSIQNLPAGTYTIAAWHEKFGVKTQSVTVTGTDHPSVTFAY